MNFRHQGICSFTTGAMPATGCLLYTNQACVGIHVLDILVQQSSLGGEQSLAPRVTFARHLVTPPLLSKRSTPHSTCRGSTVSLTLPPRSPQVEGQGHCKDDAHQHQERQPGLQKACTAGSDGEHPQREERERKMKVRRAAWRW